MTLPLARKGMAVTAVDASEPMLNVLRRKLENEPTEVRARVTLHPGDMRKLKLEYQYPLVIVPFRALQHMHTIDDQMAALTSLRQRLSPEGRLAFDVFLPKFERVFSGIGQEIEEMSWKAIDAGRDLVIRRFFVKDGVDVLRQTFSGRFIYRTFDGAKLLQEESDSVTITCYTYGQLQLLFHMTGLEPVAEYGTFAKAPLRGDSPEMIFILRKKMV